jgi:hypothetical protein
MFRPGVPSLIHVPAIMAVRHGLQQHFLFQLLKSGRKYNSRRNHYFGRLSVRQRNWTWSETWRHPIKDVAVGREQFAREVFVPALQSVLSKHPAEVCRLKAFWRNGQHRITEGMHLAHGHLKHVEEYVNAYVAC